MKTIISIKGEVCNLSEEVYVLKNIKSGERFGSQYSNGVEVRLISGVNDSPVPGYHFSKGWVTVCRVRATTAEFAGVRKSQIELIVTS